MKRRASTTINVSVQTLIHLRESQRDLTLKIVYYLRLITGMHLDPSSIKSQSQHRSKGLNKSQLNK
jgi:hypothetical protein